MIASSLVKQINTTKFDSSVDLHIRLGVDPKKADQAIRGTVTLPHGTGKTKKVLVLCTPEKEADAKAAGADFVGLDEFIQKIEGGWVDVDVIVATPDFYHAEHANAMAARLAAGIGDTVYPVEANAVFAELPEDRIHELAARHTFYIWEPARNVARLMTAWDTPPEAVDALIADVAG